MVVPKVARVETRTSIEVGPKLECDGSAGEVYMKSSRGKVATLEACEQSCVSTAGCKSFSYFHSGWCSHWGTHCSKTKWNKKVAMSARVASIKPRTWTDIGAGVECDGSAGEVYMKSSRGKVATLEACKQSCADTAGCKSFSYFKSGWCSHWATFCSKTKWNKKVAMSARSDATFEEDA